MGVRKFGILSCINVNVVCRNTDLLGVRANNGAFRSRRHTELGTADDPQAHTVQGLRCQHKNVESLGTHPPMHNENSPDPPSPSDAAVDKPAIWRPKDVKDIPPAALPLAVEPLEVDDEGDKKDRYCTA